MNKRMIDKLLKSKKPGARGLQKYWRSAAGQAKYKKLPA
jgi:hypothetical protein